MTTPHIPTNTTPITSDESQSCKAAQHIQSPFSPLAVLTRDDILRDFHKDVVSPCNQPLLCHLNVNNFLFKNLGPFEPTYTCLDNPEVKKLIGTDKFGFCPDSLAKHLTLENILVHQQNDEKLKQILQSVDSQETSLSYFYMIQLKYFWPHMGNDIKDFCKGRLQSIALPGVPMMIFSGILCDSFFTVTVTILQYSVVI